MIKSLNYQFAIATVVSGMVYQCPQNHEIKKVLGERYPHSATVSPQRLFVNHIRKHQASKMKKPTGYPLNK